jgi:hypothetical protein
MSIHIEEHTGHVLLEVILALYQYQSCRGPEVIPGVYLIYTNTIPIPGLYLIGTRQKSASDPILGPNWYESFEKDPIPGPRAHMDFKKDTQYQDQTSMSKCRYQSNTGMNKFSQET